MKNHSTFLSTEEVFVLNVLTLTRGLTTEFRERKRSWIKPAHHKRQGWSLAFFVSEACLHVGNAEREDPGRDHPVDDKGQRSGNHRRYQPLAKKHRPPWGRWGMASLRRFLGPDTEGKAHQKHPPPEQKEHHKGGNGIHQFLTSSSSISVPQKSFGWRNRTRVPCAPIFGSPSPSTRAPEASSLSRASMMSATS